MKNQKPILILFILIVSITALHFQKNQIQHNQVDTELQTLKKQQSNFQASINALINNITTVSAEADQQQNKTQKITILENALVSERQTIFQLSNSIIPPFNLSQNSCNQLTNDQKINILDQVSKIKLQLNQFKLIAAKLPQNDQLKMINRDIQKQNVLVDSIEKIAYSKCQGSIILSATIFQSNIYASNWFLGNQTIDDLIEEYYQRSIQYNNITNCPLTFPFFDGKQCINCTGNKSLFNMQTKTCDSCPIDTELNVALRICNQVPHNSDFTKTNNYNLDGASQLPTPDPNLTPCPPEAPFYNGSCVNCNKGLWWSVNEKKCKSCVKGQAFDKNVRQCIKPNNNTLTVLEGTRWVTGVGNQTKVLQERANILAKNNVSTLNYCSQDSPYFDGIMCISCDKQFDLNTGRCTQAKNGTAYNENLHSYVTPDTNKQTDPKAANLLISSPLPPPTQPLCNSTNPYYDGIACIKCPEPFVLFNVDTNKCSACNAQQIYNASSSKCQKRSAIKISSNFNRLMGTPLKSIDAYKAQLLNKIQNNNNSLIQKCSSQQYSNYVDCFTCSSSQYFNVETKKCDVCNETFNTTTNICSPKTIYLTNLNTSNNFILNSHPLSYYENIQKAISGPKQYCKLPTPYASNSQCITCNQSTPYFNLQTSSCTACPVGLVYYNESRNCVKPTQVSNIQALENSDNVFENGNFTLANLKKNQSATTGPTILCKTQTPAYNGISCYSCNGTKFYSLAINTCVQGKLVSNITQLKLRKNVKQTDNYTLANIQSIINTQSKNIPEVQCKNTKPFEVNNKCINCDQFQVFDLKNGKCIQPNFYTNINALQKANYLQTPNSNLKSINDTINKTPLPSKQCDQKSPLFNGKNCTACPNAIYNLSSLGCSNCDNKTYFNTTTHKCDPKPTFYPNLNNNNWTVNEPNGVFNVLSMVSSRKNISGSAPCPNQYPFYNNQTYECAACPATLNYNYDSKTCAQCLSNQQVDPNTHECKAKLSEGLYQTSLNSSNLIYGGLPKAQHQDNYDNNKTTYPKIQDCPSTTPYYDGYQCIKCFDFVPYFNLVTKLCQNCPDNSTYNVQLKDCLNDNNSVVKSAPNIAKMYSTIFG